LQGYSRLLHDHQLQVEKHLPNAAHATLLMVLPATVDLSQLPASHANLHDHQKQMLAEAMGIGYARLCIQLVSKLMGMSSIWMLDDNLSDCWRLPFEKFIASKGQHGQLEPVGFDTVMRTIEHQVTFQLMMIALCFKCRCDLWVRHVAFAPAFASACGPKGITSVWRSLTFGLTQMNDAR